MSEHFCACELELLLVMNSIRFYVGNEGKSKKRHNRRNILE